ncbi:MAG: SPOR domain-containing protein [Gammaproteobacteria bacterium]
MNTRIARSRRVQGGTLIGFVLGLLAGLGIALAVAVYVTKVPVPFVDRGLSRKPEQDAAEAERNKGWNPNSQLGVRPAAPPQVPVQPGAQEEGKAERKEAEAAPGQPTVEARDPIAELLESREGRRTEDAPSAAVPADPFNYFVQVGAFRNQQEAENQRARVALLGIATEITEREQNGRSVFRVRVGPFNQRNAAEATREQLEVNGIESALVRVQR